MRPSVERAPQTDTSSLELFVSKILCHKKCSCLFIEPCIAKLTSLFSKTDQLVLFLDRQKVLHICTCRSSHVSLVRVPNVGDVSDNHFLEECFVQMSDCQVQFSNVLCFSMDSAEENWRQLLR